MNQENLFFLLSYLLLFQAGGDRLSKPEKCPTRGQDEHAPCVVTSHTFPVTMLCNGTVKEIPIVKMIIKDKYGNVGTKTNPVAAQKQCNQSMKTKDFGTECQLTDPKSLEIPNLKDIVLITVEYLCHASIYEDVFHT